MVEPNFFKIFKNSKTKHVQETYIKQIGAYHASGLTKCLRSQYYSFFVPAEYSDATKLIFRAGEEIHQQMKDAILVEYPDAEFEKACETTIGKYKILGHVDVVIPDKFAVEIKSTSWPKKEADEFHIQQLNAYLVLLNLPFGYLVYVTKNTLIPVQFKIMKNEQLWKTTIARATKLHNYLTTKKLPDAEFLALFGSKKNWWCDNCFYRKDCKENLNLAIQHELLLAKELHKKKVKTDAN